MDFLTECYFNIHNYGKHDLVSECNGPDGINFIENQNLNTYSNEYMINYWTLMRQQMRTVSGKLIGDPKVFVSDDGNSAWAFFKSSFEVVNSGGDNLINNYASFCTFSKLNDRWTYHTTWEEPLDKSDAEIAVEVDLAQMEKYVGIYKVDSQENSFEFEVKLVNGQLVNLMNGVETKFIPLSDHIFKVPNYDFLLLFSLDQTGSYNIVDMTGLGKTMRGWRVVK
jgi:hypothetical protein